MAVISLYGFKSNVVLPIVNEGDLLRKATFTLIFFSNGDVENSKDISEHLGIQERVIVPIQFKENYSLFKPETDQKRN
jgi:hypothetical protein